MLKLSHITALKVTYLKAQTYIEKNNNNNNNIILCKNMLVYYIIVNIMLKF